MSNKALGKHIQAVMPFPGKISTTDLAMVLLMERDVVVSVRELRKELDLMLQAKLVVYDVDGTPRWSLARSKRDPLPAGHHRRMTDAKCAWKHMSPEQRRAFMAWVEEFTLAQSEGPA